MSRIKELQQDLADAACTRAGRPVNLTRGNHCAAQTALSLPMLENKSFFSCRSNISCANYGPPDCLLGIPESRAFFAEYLGVDDPQDVAVLGNSSLSIMSNIINWSLVANAYGWSWQNRTFLCEGRGYDRHFTIYASKLLDMRRVPLAPDGPDLDALAEGLQDPHVAGMICVPQYSNPTGITYSREKIEAMAEMEPANPSFQWVFDNAYAHHHLVKDPGPGVPIWDIFKKAGALDRLWLVGSLSKVTFPGEAIAAVASSPRNIKWLEDRLFAHTIGYPKLPQLWHHGFLPDLASVKRHMEKHREILAPKFERLAACLAPLEERGVVRSSHPKGGYFIGLEVPQGCAARIVSTCAKHDLILTKAGAPFTNGVNEDDNYLRLAPSCIEEAGWPHIERVLPAAIELAACG